jgi:NADPH2:quinone reductase
MKAAVMNQYGGPEVLQVEHVDVPTPGPGQVLIRVEAVSVNYADIVRRKNAPYPFPTHLPAILGGEVAGFVEEVGEGVDLIELGQRVFAMLGGGGIGGYAQYAVADARQVLKLPDEMDLDVACTLVVAGVTAYQMLKDVAQIEPGDTVFIPGVLGGVGSYALQLARVFGAGQIIVGASTDARRSEALRRGADHAVDYTKSDWHLEVKNLTQGRGADIVLDMSGGKLFDQSLDALAPFGRLIAFGTASGTPGNVSTRRLLGSSQTVSGYYVGGWFAGRPQRALRAFHALVELIQTGAVSVSIAARLPLEKVSEAHQIMEARQSEGKFVVKPWL